MKSAAHTPQRDRTPVATLAKAGGWGTFALWLIFALLALTWALPAGAGQLDVLNDAAYGGGSTACDGGPCGLRVTPGSTCTAPEDELFITTSTVSGDKVACDRIIAGDVGGVQTDGDTTFTAGDEIVLRDSFTVRSVDSFTGSEEVVGRMWSTRLFQYCQRLWGRNTPLQYRR